MKEETGVEASMTVEGYERTDRNGQERDSQLGLDSNLLLESKVELDYVVG
jgi:hypothetical protein